MNYFGTFGSNESEALSALLPVINRALEAHQQGNYQAFLAVITDELANKISEQGFRKAHREIAPQLGALQSKKLLAFLRKGDNPTLLFAGKYSNSIDDIVINVSFKNGTTPPLIDWLWIE